MTKHKLIVKPHRPMRAWVMRGLGVLLVAISLAGSFYYGQIRAGFDRAATEARVTALTSELRQARAEAEGFREQLALVQHSSQVDRRAKDSVQGDISEMQQEILELREEIAFYRGIVSPEDAEAGLKVQGFSLTPGPDPRMYHYRLVLIQAIKHDRRATGTVDVVIYGARNGEPVSIALAELVVGELGSLDYSFKYFQGFEGDLFLPPDFRPGRVEITVRPRDRRQEAFTRSYDWPSMDG